MESSIAIGDAKNLCIPIGQEIIVKAGFKHYSHATCTSLMVVKQKINEVLI